MALHAIGKRSQPSIPKPVQRRIKSKPLFDPDDDEDISRSFDEFDHIRDPELALAIQASLEDHNKPSASFQDGDMAKFDLRSVTSEPSPSKLSPPATPRSKLTLQLHDSDDDLYTSPSRLETALSIAGAGPVRRLSGTLHDLPSQSAFGKAALLVSPKTASRPMPILQSPLSESEESMGEVLPVQAIEAPHGKPSPVAISAHVGPSPKVLQEAAQDSDDDMEEVPVIDGGHVHHMSERSVPTAIPVPEDAAKERRSTFPASPQLSIQLPNSLDRPLTSSMITPEARTPESDNESDIEWSRSPSPVLGTAPESTDQGASAAEETWDAAEEMDPHAEEGEFARFISQVKGKDLDAVRHEIDEEIRTLNQQKKAAMRDSEDITQQMISQIMVCVSC